MYIIPRVKWTSQCVHPIRPASLCQGEEPMYCPCSTPPEVTKCSEEVVLSIFRWAIGSIIWTCTWEPVYPHLVVDNDYHYGLTITYQLENTGSLPLLWYFRSLGLTVVIFTSILPHTQLNRDSPYQINHWKRAHNAPGRSPPRTRGT